MHGFNQFVLIQNRLLSRTRWILKPTKYPEKMSPSIPLPIHHIQCYLCAATFKWHNREEVLSCTTLYSNTSKKYTIILKMSPSIPISSEFRIHISLPSVCYVSSDTSRFPAPFWIQLPFRFVLSDKLQLKIQLMEYHYSQ